MPGVMIFIFILIFLRHINSTFFSDSRFVQHVVLGKPQDRASGRTGEGLWIYLGGSFPVPVPTFPKFLQQLLGIGKSIVSEDHFFSLPTNSSRPLFF